MENSFKKLRL